MRDDRDPPRSRGIRPRCRPAPSAVATYAVLALCMADGWTASRAGHHRCSLLQPALHCCRTAPSLQSAPHHRFDWEKVNLSLGRVWTYPGLPIPKLICEIIHSYPPRNSPYPLGNNLIHLNQEHALRLFTFACLNQLKPKSIRRVRPMPACREESSLQPQRTDGAVWGKRRQRRPGDEERMLLADAVFAAAPATNLQPAPRPGQLPPYSWCQKLPRCPRTEGRKQSPQCSRT